MKCSQCGCTDLVEVKFPQETSLILTAVGLAGETNAYDIKNQVYCNSFICLNCGHFEFFNLSLAEQIKCDIKIKEEAKENINKIENEIHELWENISSKLEEKEKLEIESKNLDITLRRYNEVQEQLSSIENDIENLNKAIKEKEDKIKKLEQTLRWKRNNRLEKD